VRLSDGLLAVPVKTLRGALVGAAYASAVTTAVGTAVAMIFGIAVDRPNLSQIGTHLLLGTLAVAPVVGLTLGAIAFGSGAIIGTVTALADGSIGAGLEWALIAGLGCAAGIWVSYAQLGLTLLGLACGGVAGGAVGFLTWLTCTGRRRRTLTGRLAIGYAAAMVLIAAYSCVSAGWVLSY
jgi:hypothetical protein